MKYLLLSMLAVVPLSVKAENLSDSQLAEKMVQKLCHGLSGSWETIFEYPIFNGFASKEGHEMTLFEKMEQEDRNARFENKLQKGMQKVYKDCYHHRGRNHSPMLTFKLFVEQHNRESTPLRKHARARLSWSLFSNSNVPSQWINTYYQAQLYQGQP